MSIKIPLTPSSDWTMYLSPEIYTWWSLIMLFNSERGREIPEAENMAPCFPIRKHKCRYSPSRTQLEDSTLVLSSLVLVYIPTLMDIEVPADFRICFWCTRTQRPCNFT